MQIVGADPKSMAEAARFNADRGAQIIDINMGCPAKKVCRTAAGSALLKDPQRVAQILGAVVAAVDIPVTLKIRTGWDRKHRNAVTIARIAEDCGVQALAVHGRTKACGFSGSAEYDTIRRIKSAVRLPIIANGRADSSALGVNSLSTIGKSRAMSEPGLAVSSSTTSSPNAQNPPPIGTFGRTRPRKNQGL